MKNIGNVGKLYLFTNIGYKSKRNEDFLNFKDSSKIFPIKNNGNVNFPENSIYSQIFVTN